MVLTWCVCELHCGIKCLFSSTAKKFLQNNMFTSLFWFVLERSRYFVPLIYPAWISLTLFYHNWNKQKISWQNLISKSSTGSIRKQNLSQTEYNIQQIQRIKCIQHWLFVQLSLILQQWQWQNLCVIIIDYFQNTSETENVRV